MLLDAPTANRWPSLLALSGALVGRLDWWPSPPADAGSPIIAALAGSKHPVEDRPSRRPSHFADAGRRCCVRTAKTKSGAGATAAPTATSASPPMPMPMPCRWRSATGEWISSPIPGTYCYHGERAWRSYFRSTIAHNTAELGGRSQSSEGGPFMWVRHAQSPGNRSRRRRRHSPVDRGARRLRFTRPARLHRRSVLLDRASRSIDIIDEIEGGSHDIRLAFHLGPEVQVELDGSCAMLSWPDAAKPGTARLELPSALRWTLHRGQTEPILGWYSSGLGRRVPTFSLLGCGRCMAGAPLATRLEFLTSANCPRLAHPDEPYHGAHRMRTVTRRWRSKRRPDEPAGIGSAEVQPDRAAP